MSNYDFTEQIDTTIDLERFLKLCPSKYIQVVLLKSLGYNQKQIGYIMGFTQQRVSTMLITFYKCMNGNCSKNSKLYAASQYIKNYNPRFAS